MNSSDLVEVFSLAELLFKIKLGLVQQSLAILKPQMEPHLAQPLNCVYFKPSLNVGWCKLN